MSEDITVVVGTVEQVSVVVTPPQATEVVLATGVPGVPGDNGADGPAGAAGAKGDKGDKGDPGDPGADGSLNALALDGSNSMEADIDMGGHRVGDANPAFENGQLVEFSQMNSGLAARMQFRGNYDAGATYKYNDVVIDADYNFWILTDEGHGDYTGVDPRVGVLTLVAGENLETPDTSSHYGSQVLYRFRVTEDIPNVVGFRVVVGFDTAPDGAYVALAVEVGDLPPFTDDNDVDNLFVQVDIGGLSVGQHDLLFHDFSGGIAPPVDSLLVAQSPYAIVDSAGALASTSPGDAQGPWTWDTTLRPYVSGDPGTFPDTFIGIFGPDQDTSYYPSIGLLIVDSNQWVKLGNANAVSYGQFTAALTIIASEIFSFLGPIEASVTAVSDEVTALTNTVVTTTEHLGTAYNSRGTWDTSYGYDIGDYVKASDDSGYMAILANTAQDPTIQPDAWTSIAPESPIYLRSYDGQQDDPATAQTPAPIGSIMIYSAAGVFQIWKKDGVDNADWSLGSLEQPDVLIDDSTTSSSKVYSSTKTASAIATAIAALVASSPAALDTLNELATALGDDPNFATTVATALGNKQPIDAELTAIAGLTSAADKAPYFTGLGAAALADLSSFGRTLMALANAAALRTAGGLVIGTDVEAWDADLDAIAALSATNDDVIQRKSGSWTNRTMAQVAVDLEAAALDARYKVPLAGSVIGAYYTTVAFTAQSFTIGAGALGVMHCMPAWIEAGTLDRLAQQHTSGATASELMRLGLYADNGRGYPGALIIDAGTIDLSTSTGIKTVTISQVVARGLYWLAAVRQGPTNTAQTVGVNGAVANGRLVLPSMAAIGSNLYDAPEAWTQSSVTAALPSNFSGTSAPTNLFAQPVWYRYSA